MAAEDAEGFGVTGALPPQGQPEKPQRWGQQTTMPISTAIKAAKTNNVTT
jgi:hypothetical protein